MDGESHTVALKAPLSLRMADPKQVLQELIGKDAPYRVEDRIGTLVIRPVTRDGKPVRTLLDTAVSDLPLKDVTLRDALDRVVTVFSSAGPPKAAGSLGVSSPQRQRVFSLFVGKSTVADLLSEIVAAHGEAGWQVTYRAFDGNAGAYNPNIGFFTFDGSEFGRGFPRPVSVK